ncbi:hypothetical protein KUK78_004787 [Vibrio parahaemolyticus]|nr:hypothetical protein [Vibrio parahaemolyticus]
MNTFTVLKPEQDLNTIFITQDEQTAVEAFEGSTVPLMITEMPIKSSDTNDIVQLYKNEWVDLNSFKYPFVKHLDTYVYTNLSSDEFINLLVQCPEIINKMISVQYYAEEKEIVKDLENELYEFFQTFELVDK